jgi:ferredoxin-NADP reductase/DMSO/TMAO reductase YedYZ molybdopterin-dependent catalytic subunit
MTIMSPVSRGFRHLRRAQTEEADRVPPGQHVTEDFPVLSAGPTPRTPLEDWTFSVTQGGQTKKSWTWAEFRALPAETITADIHCVTRWSKLGTRWRGVPVDTLLEAARYDAPYVLAFCDGGYTTNLPVEDVTGGKAWGAFDYDGGPLPPEHGGPARLSCRTCTSGRAPSGCAAWSCATTTRRVSGRPTATTCMETHGSNSGTRATEPPGETTPPDPPGAWQVATVTSVTRETDSVVTIELGPPDWPGHRAGQHLDVRLTAEDGYTAERSYSIASAPGEPVAITVERLEGGEVSPYLTEDLRAGDELELRGPIGGYFVWEPADGGPLMLLAGGSGVVPLRAILRHRSGTGSDVPARLLYSARTLPDVIYHGELDQYRDGAQVIYTLTRSQPPGWTGHTGRIDQALLAEAAWAAETNPLALICGPTSFVETAAAALVGLGYPPERVKTERFGATGGR